MTTATSVKDELHQMIDGMTLEAAELLLDMINNLNDTDELTPEEEAAVAEGRDQIQRGEFVTLGEYRARRGL